MKRTVFAVVLFVLVLIVSSHVVTEKNMSKDSKLRVTIDKDHSNENWIQVTVNLKDKVHSIQFIAQDGSSTMVEPPSWEKHHMTFVGKPASSIPFGSKVTLRFWFLGSGSTTISLLYNKGNSATSDGKEPKPDEPSSNDPRIVKLIKSVHEYKQTGKEPSAHTTGENSLRKRNKAALAKALSDLKINDSLTKAFLFAIFGLESEEMYFSNGQAQRDTSKDCKKPPGQCTQQELLSKNVSPLNMNIHMLQIIKFQGNPDHLNDINNIKLVVETAVNAIDHFGLVGFLNFHRAGMTGYKDPIKYDRKFKMTEYRVGVYNIMHVYFNNRELFDDGRKVWADIPHV